jgi:hypothetical protein
MSAALASTDRLECLGGPRDGEWHPGRPAAMLYFAAPAPDYTAFADPEAYVPAEKLPMHAYKRGHFRTATGTRIECWQYVGVR